MQKRLSLRKNRPILYQHLVSYPYRHKEGAELSYGCRTMQSNTALLSPKDTHDYMKSLSEKYKTSVVLLAVTPQGKVYG